MHAHGTQRTQQCVLLTVLSSAQRACVPVLCVGSCSQEHTQDDSSTHAQALGNGFGSLVWYDEHCDKVGFGM
jgi:hypothetical protein